MAVSNTALICGKANCSPQWIITGFTHFSQWHKDRTKVVVVTDLWITMHSQCLHEQFAKQFVMQYVRRVALHL
jgi:hypothetical protein